MKTTRPVSSERTKELVKPTPRFLIALGVWGCFCSAHLVNAGTISPFLINPANNHQYVLLTSETWTSSESEAVSLGGHLATINDQSEQNWVFTTFGGYGGAQRLLWIGLNDAAVEGQFRWSSGEAVAYTHWASGEPNNANGNEDYVAMYYPNHSSAGFWNDWNNRTSDPIGLPFNGVVELVPEPQVIWLALLGLGCTMIRWQGGRALNKAARRPNRTLEPLEQCGEIAKGILPRSAGRKAGGRQRTSPPVRL